MFNWYGAYTFAYREILRPIKLFHQTLLSPTVNSILLFTVFNLSVGSANHEIAGIKYANFIGYGLIIMNMIQMSFANTSSSIIVGKVVGNIIDLLMVPLEGLEIVIGFSIGAILRGILSGLLVALVLSPFMNYTILHHYLLIWISINSCLLAGLLGIFTGLLANDFEQNAASNNYIIAPLTFLSGTFYSVNVLPKFLLIINYFNPFFYMIDGFRYCFTNYNNSNITIGIFYLFFINAILFVSLVILINRGWRLKE